MTKEEKILLDFLKNEESDAIVVEGYDGVGKGHVLNILSEAYGVEPYRPDYNMWQSHDLRKSDRWKISGFFWDIYSHFNIHSKTPLLFDRGVISGAVYNHDREIAKDYKKMLRDMKVIHILVCCNKDDYKKMQAVRGVDISDFESQWRSYLEYNLEYIKCFEYAGVNYLIHGNVFDESTEETVKMTCIGCGHYNHGWCRHPIMNTRVSGNEPRCKYSKDVEVQDDPKMQCV